MKIYTEIPATEKQLASITCDKCKTAYEVGDLGADEFLSIKLDGGFDSAFGDGSSVEGDFCSPCTRELLGDYLRFYKVFV